MANRKIGLVLLVLSFGVVINILTCHESFSQTWQSCDSLARIYVKKQNYDSALVYGEKALQTLRVKYGENDTLYAEMLYTVMMVNIYKGDLPNAIEWCKKEKDIRKIVQGDKSAAYGRTLNNLASLYKASGNFQAAEPMLIEAKSIFREKYGQKNVDYAKAVNNLAFLYRDMGSVSPAESQFREVIGIYKELFGEKSNYYTEALNNLGVLFYDIGNYRAAEPILLNVSNLWKQLLGDKHPMYATSLNNLAVLYKENGNFTAAESLYIQALNIRKTVLGEKNTDYASSLDNLALLYQATGNYPAAEPLHLKALNIRKEVLGVNDPSYAESLNNTALLYQQMGNFPAAKPLFLEAKKILKETIGENDPTYATIVNNLAGFYSLTGDFEAAEPLYTEAMNIRKAVLGEHHPDYATSLNNLASLYSDMENYKAAEFFFDEEGKIIKETLGANHPMYATYLSNLASMHHLMHKYKEAETEYTEALRIRKIALGSMHTDYIEVLNNLAVLYNNMNNFNAAKPLFLECIENTGKIINQNFEFLSEKEKELYLRTRETYISNFYDFSLKRKSEDNDLTKICYNNILINKGLLLKSSTAMRNAIQSSNDTSLIAMYEKWIDLKKEISMLQSTEISKRYTNPEILEQTANTIEKEIVKKSSVVGDFTSGKHITWEDVRKKLKKDEAAIEFVHSQVSKDTILYSGLIVRSDSKYPEMIFLFVEKDLESLLGRNNINNISYINKIYGTSKVTDTILFNLIWKPMEKYLNGIKTIYYSPDGLLHKVSFSAISDGKNRYLCDNYSLNRVNSTGIVVTPESRLIDKTLTACIIGGINYTAEPSEKIVWQDLPGTLTEINGIQKRLSENDVPISLYAGKEATEVKFKNTYSKGNIQPEILHIATHGFFYPDPLSVRKEAVKIEKTETGMVAFRGGNPGFGTWQFVQNKNPLMRSGLVFSGANRVWTEPYSGTDNDGVLTAQEVTQLDMSKTRLVVLSACETGLGDIRGSEGVYGLQRAFKMAGIKNIIMSLWQVPDAETSEFMNLFYSKLITTKDIQKSFNETSSEMRGKYDPYYWASFVLIE